VRRAFRSDDLDGSDIGPAAARFERPTLAASLERAGRAHRAGLARRVGLGAAGAVLAVIGGVAMIALAQSEVSTRSPASAAASVTSAASTYSASAPSATPTSPLLTPGPEPWPPNADQVVGHPAARAAYVVQSPQAADRRATVWERCRPAEPNQYPKCDGDNIARAVEVVDGKGHRLVHLLEFDAVVRPAFGGTFAILPSWGSDGHVLVSPTMTEPKPFAVETGVRPRRGQVFTQCSAGPCLVDLHGTVRLLDLPDADRGWNSDTSSGWVGVQSVESSGATRVFIQQADGAFATVDVRVTVPAGEGDLPGASSWPDGRVAIWSSTQSGFSQVAVSADRGRSWTVRWGNRDGVDDSSSFASMPVAAHPDLVISPLKAWPPKG
jgi:hypothetical protein